MGLEELFDTPREHSVYLLEQFNRETYFQIESGHLFEPSVFFRLLYDTYQFVLDKKDTSSAVNKRLRDLRQEFYDQTIQENTAERDILWEWKAMRRTRFFYFK